MAFDSHLIQSNAFESNASANANADESNANASANAAVTGESNASASANAAFALAFANASAFEHKPGLYAFLCVKQCFVGVSETWRLICKITLYLFVFVLFMHNTCNNFIHVCVCTVYAQHV